MNAFVEIPISDAAQDKQVGQGCVRGAIDGPQRLAKLGKACPRRRVIPGKSGTEHNRQRRRTA
jgi:hypothetical protein